MQILNASASTPTTSLDPAAFNQPKESPPTRRKTRESASLECVDKALNRRRFVALSPNLSPCNPPMIKSGFYDFDQPPKLSTIILLSQ